MEKEEQKTLIEEGEAGTSTQQNFGQRDRKRKQNSEVCLFLLLRTHLYFGFVFITLTLERHMCFQFFNWKDCKKRRQSDSSETVSGDSNKTVKI